MRRISTLLLLAACASPPADTPLDLVFDPCAPVVLVPSSDATPEERRGIADAIAMWAGAGVTGITLDAVEGAPRIPVRFDGGAGALHGLYSDETGVVYINRDLVVPHERAVTVAHELGHAFGLFHVSAGERVSVMNPANLTAEPTGGDAQALAALWGACR